MSDDIEMTEVVPPLRRTAARGPYGLLVGFLLGVIVAALVAPGGGTREIVSSTGGESGEAITAGDSADAGTSDGSADGATTGTDASAAGSAAPTGPATGSNGATSSGPAAGAVRGVTANTIKIGVALLDTSALKYAGPDYDPGPTRPPWEALIDGWKRQGQLPVHGRNIQFVYRDFNVVDTTAERAACVGLVQDEGVFAVVAPALFHSGGECTAREFQTPTLLADSGTDDVFQRSAPYLFGMGASESRTLRNWMYWAESKGFLKGKRIGLYYPNDPATGELVNKTLKASLAKLGYELAAEATSGDANGGPNDALAVQRFRAARVDLALLLVSRQGFMTQAKAQGYKPTYIDSDYLFGTNALSAKNYPQDQYDGSYAMTAIRNGEIEAGMTPPPGEQPCMDNYTRFSRRSVEGSAHEFERALVRLACDEGSTILKAIQAAGPNLTPTSFVAALESFHTLETIHWSTITWGPGKHDGASQQRTLRYHADCKCFKAIGNFEPMFQP